MKVFTDPISRRRMAVGRFDNGSQWQVVDYGEVCHFGMSFASGQVLWDTWTERVAFDKALERFAN